MDRGQKAKFISDESFFYRPKVFEPAQNILWHKSKWHKFSANSFDIEPLCYFDRHADKKVLMKTVSI